MASTDSTVWLPAGERYVALGVTGGIACGKSTVGEVLRRLGVAVCDTDELARHVVLPGSEALHRIIERFGQRVLAPEGHLDRRALGRIVFEDAKARLFLNDLLHPRIRQLRDEWLAQREREQTWAAVLIPLLFEAGETEGWDATICVSAPPQVVLERLQKRGLAMSEAHSRVQAQWPLEEKEKQADYVIHNHGGLDALEEETLCVLNKIRKEIAHHG